MMKESKTRYKDGDLISLGAVFSEVYEAKEWGGQWRLIRLMREWPEIVGAEVARLTSPAFFRRDTLWLYVQDSAWMHHLQYVKLDLMERINRHLTDRPIADIRWQLLPQPQPRAGRQPAEAHPIDPEREHSFRRMTETIANRECREALQRMWRTLAGDGE